MHRLLAFVCFILMAANVTGEMLASVDVKYYLHTLENGDTPTVQLLEDNNPDVSGTHYRLNRPTKFIIHGFRSQGDTQWIVNMANALLEAEDLNVFAVDWRKGAAPLEINYLRAKENCRAVGQAVAEFVTKLGQPPDMTHIIGHSLGAHAAGFAGKTTKSKGLTVARITGLDPAGPLFRGTIDEDRLDRSDATFVDVIHTDRHTLGLPEPVGHVDFYPNEGWKQPGCGSLAWILSGYGRKKKRSLSQLLSPVDFCSHGRAYEFFTESINLSCQFLAYRCQDWDTFNSDWEQCEVCGHTGLDNRACSEMGYHSKNYPNSLGSMYLVTSKDHPPHCSVSGTRERRDAETTQSDQCVQNVSPDMRQEIWDFMDSMSDIQEMGLEQDFCSMYSDMEDIVANITAAVPNCGPEDVPDILEYIADGKYDAVAAWAEDKCPVSTGDAGFTLPSATMVIGLQLIVACVTQALAVRG